MLLLAHAAMPDRIEAATVDHGLRPEAGAEAAMVSDLCAKLAVPHRTFAVTVAEGNLQGAARAARYHALAGWLAERRLGALATAHHADDQAETLMMRLGRGSGVAGLAGVRARGKVPDADFLLLRPLLSWRRHELSDVIGRSGWAAAQDPSNSDERFDRVRIRRALAQADWIDPIALSASVSHLAEADAALEWATEREWQERVRLEDGAYTYCPAAPRAIRLRVAARIVSTMGGDPRGGAIARLVDLLETGGTATLAGVIASQQGGVWKFAAEPQTRKN